MGAAALVRRDKTLDALAVWLDTAGCAPGGEPWGAEVAR